MTKVLFTPEVELFLDDLSPTLYRLGYFSYYENADRYVTGLVNAIKADLPFKTHKFAPKYFDRYGFAMKYASFKKNRQTTWHVFFNIYLQDDLSETYVVKYIANNHVIAKYL